MTPLDDLNAKIEALRPDIEALVAILGRLREVALSDLIVEAQEDDRLAGVDRGLVAELAVQYADWTRTQEGYRSLLRRKPLEIAR